MRGWTPSALRNQWNEECQGESFLEILLKQNGLFSRVEAIVLN